jgi:hypothetical protein
MELGKTLGFKVLSKIKIMAVEVKRLYNLGEGLAKEMKNVLLVNIGNARGV